MSSTTTLALGGTGKTGARLVRRLRDAGVPVRAAARGGGDVRFDWDDAATHGPALDGVDRLYLVPPALRMDHAAQVAAFLDLAQARGVRHVTFLSARGADQAPPEAPLRAVELDLLAREGLTTTILRPAWFAQNFLEGALQPHEGVLAVPAGDGAEPFVDAEDIAAAAEASLRDPEAHAGRAYALTGPEALTHAQVAEVLTRHGADEVRYVDLTAQEFVDGAAAAGLPRDYATMLAGLLEVVRAGGGAHVEDGVRQATGREPRAFEAVVAEALGRVAAA